MSDPQTPDIKPGRSWLKIALLGSLALNLLVVGAVVGSRLGDKPNARNDRAEIRQLGTSIGPYGRALSREDRRALGREFAQNARGLRATRQEMRALGEQVVSALRVEPFDAGAVRALLDQQIAKGQEMQRMGQGLLVERLEAMTPETRATFADNLEQMLKRGPRKPSRDQ